jgi:hypothetical protein
MPGVLAPIEKAGQRAEPPTRACGAVTRSSEQFAEFRCAQVRRRHVCGLHLGECEPYLRKLIADIFRRRQPGAAHLRPAGQDQRILVLEPLQGRPPLALLIRCPRLLLDRWIGAGGSLSLDPVCLGSRVVGRMRRRVAERHCPVRPAASCLGIGPAWPVGITPCHRGRVHNKCQAAAVFVSHDHSLAGSAPPPSQVDRRVGNLGRAFADDAHSYAYLRVPLTGQTVRRQAESRGGKWSQPPQKTRISAAFGWLAGPCGGWRNREPDYTWPGGRWCEAPRVIGSAGKQISGRHVAGRARRPDHPHPRRCRVSTSPAAGGRGFTAGTPADTA